MKSRVMCIILVMMYLSRFVKRRHNQSSYQMKYLGLGIGYRIRKFKKTIKIGF